MTNINPAETTHVQVTDPYMCQLHQWTIGAQLEIRKDEIHIPDKNGLEPWVKSNRDGRWVWLAETSYELIDQPARHVATPSPKYRPLTRFAIICLQYGIEQKRFWMHTDQAQAEKQFNQYNPGTTVLESAIDNPKAAADAYDGK